MKKVIFDTHLKYLDLLFNKEDLEMDIYIQHDKSMETRYLKINKFFSIFFC